MGKRRNYLFNNFTHTYANYIFYIYFNFIGFRVKNKQKTQVIIILNTIYLSKVFIRIILDIDTIRYA